MNVEGSVKNYEGSSGIMKTASAVPIFQHLLQESVLSFGGKKIPKMGIIPAQTFQQMGQVQSRILTEECAVCNMTIAAQRMRKFFRIW
jgi:hypothetical protein